MKAKAKESDLSLVWARPYRIGDSDLLDRSCLFDDMATAVRILPCSSHRDRSYCCCQQRLPNPAPACRPRYEVIFIALTLNNFQPVST